MILKDLKDLKKLLVICQEHGVEVFKLEGVEMHLNPHVQPTVVKHVATTPTIAPGGITDQTPIQTIGDLTEEQLLYYSVSDPLANQ